MLVYSEEQQKVLKAASLLARGAVALSTEILSETEEETDEEWVGLPVLSKSKKREEFEKEEEEEEEIEETVVIDVEADRKIKQAYEVLLQQCKLNIEKFVKQKEVPEEKAKMEALLELKKWTEIAQQIETLRVNTLPNMVDISDYPEVLKLQPGQQLTIGDLHANALKFVYYLVRHGILTMNKEDYERLVLIYNRDREDLKKRHFIEFEEILKRSTLNPGATIRLIGDEVSDRGNNDYFIFLILQKLQDPNNATKIPIEILFSNHGLGFLRYYESKDGSTKVGVRPNGSLKAFDTLIQQDVELAKKMKTIIQTMYLPNLKALSYTIDNTVQPPHISIFTHAPVGLKTIKLVAEQLNISFNSEKIKNDVYELARTMDAINERFASLVKEKKISQYLKKDSPLYRLIWLRYNDPDFEEERMNSLSEHYTMSWTHGHDNDGIVPEKVSTFVRSLDGKLGKGKENDYEIDYIHHSFEKSAHDPSIELAKKGGQVEQETPKRDDLISRAKTVQHLSQTLVNANKEKAQLGYSEQEISRLFLENKREIKEFDETKRFKERGITTTPRQKLRLIQLKKSMVETSDVLKEALDRIDHDRSETPQISENQRLKNLNALYTNFSTKLQLFKQYCHNVLESQATKSSQKPSIPSLQESSSPNAPENGPKLPSTPRMNRDA